MDTDLTWTAWRKSSRSGQSQNCVEVRSELPTVIGVRDSKDPDGPTLAFAPSQWRTFVAGVKSGQFGHL